MLLFRCVRLSTPDPNTIQSFFFVKKYNTFLVNNFAFCMCVLSLEQVKATILEVLVVNHGVTFKEVEKAIEVMRWQWNEAQIHGSPSRFFSVDDETSFICPN